MVDNLSTGARRHDDDDYDYYIGSPTYQVLYLYNIGNTTARRRDNVYIL